MLLLLFGCFGRAPVAPVAAEWVEIGPLSSSVPAVTMTTTPLSVTASSALPTVTLRRPQS